MKIWTDGSGFNGQASKFGIKTEMGKYATFSFNDKLSSNVMEYCAILFATIMANDGDEILSDSQLAVNQINGLWKVKERHLFPLRHAAYVMIEGKKLTLKWIPREQNRADKIV